MKRVGWIVLVMAVACGPSAKSDDGGAGGGGVDSGPNDRPDADLSSTGSISGTVWAPGNAPGMVPDGQEIPVFDAVVYLSNTPPPPIPQEAHCDQCVDPPGSHVFTDHLGQFSITGIVPGTYWIAIQKGQFRREQQIVVGEGQAIDLPVAATTLPSAHDPETGAWVPRVAMAIGDYDDLEDILGKMGLGEVDASGRYVAASAAGAIDIYDNGGSGFTGMSLGTLTELVSDLDRMLGYHIIFIPCAGTSNTAALQDPQVLQNIRDYVAAGGKLYVTDWSGEWHDNVFPAQVQLGGTTEDTPASAFDPGPPPSWDTTQFGDANGSPYESDNAEAAIDDLRLWLDGQQGPTATSDAQTTYDASLFTVEGNWNTIEELVPVEIGVDDKGFPVVDEPIAWVIGGEGTSTPKKPLTVTYEPVGCGRVLYSTYHTTDDTHVGLVPQERVLVYLIMEIGVCKSGPIID